MVGAEYHVAHALFWEPSWGGHDSIISPKGHCLPKRHAHLTLTGGSLGMLMTPSIFARLSLVGPMYSWGGRPPWVPAHDTLSTGAGEGGQGGFIGAFIYFMPPLFIGRTVFSCTWNMLLSRSLPSFFGMLTPKKCHLPYSLPTTLCAIFLRDGRALVV